MHVDKFSQPVLSEQDLFNLYMTDPSREIKKAFVDTQIQFADCLGIEKLPKLIQYHVSDESIEDFDRSNQTNWLMPEYYQSFDIAQYVLDQCKTDDELQRVGEELLEFQSRDMFMLLRYLKYLVDTMRKHDIIWGVGRGSSVSSYVLYLIGVHRINSLFYDLSIDEFLK
jgi:DNA polymerase III alpha subunit